MRYLWLLFFLPAVIFSCADDKMEYVDPMVFGLAENIEDASVGIAAGSFGGALTGLRAQRIKLIGKMAFIENDGYSGDDYGLEDKEAALQRVAEALAKVEFLLDSVWNASIQTHFNAVNPNSAGIQNFGLNAFAQTSTRVAAAQSWLMAEKDDDSVEPWLPIRFVELQESIMVLIGLSNLNDQEVIDFVNALRAQYATMLQQYADLESEVNTSPYFSKAQKELYARLAVLLEEMGVTIEEELSLDTKDELDMINRDLYALVHFVENNYTSPPQRPRVYGEISSITELRWFSEVATTEDYNNTWVLTADIDAAETHRWNLDQDERGFQTIKGETSCNFDGQFHFISGLRMTKLAERGGFFEDIRGGSIKNLALINLHLSAHEELGVGGQSGVLAGWLTNTHISRVFTHGKAQIFTQSGTFLGRPQGGNVVENSFSVVDAINETGAVYNWNSSFIGLPVFDLRLTNVYNLGASFNTVFFGFPHHLALTASGVFFDPESVGVTLLENLYRADTYYQDTSPTELSDVVVALPTANWNNLANFPGFSSDIWEIRTVPQIDPHPRPYLKGFNYDAIQDFLVPGQ